MTVPDLVLRAVKGAPLTTAEGDSNFSTLRDFSNSMSALIGVALNEDGTVKANAVTDLAVKAREISQRGLKFTSAFAAVDTGVVNSMTVSFNPVMAVYEDLTVLFVRAKYGNTGPATLKVDALTAIAIKKNGGQDLEAGDILGKQWFAVVYYGGEFHLLGGSTVASGGTSETNFTGLTRYDPDAVALPGNGLASTFTHALAAIPTQLKICLVCVNAAGALGYALADQVPLDQFFDANCKPAFGVDYNITDIIVSQNMAQPYVNRKDAPVGTAVQITEADWQLKVTAAKTFNESTLIFPALDIQVANPDGAIGYGKDLFFINRGRGSGKGHYTRLDMASKVLTRLDFKAALTNANMAPFRLADGVDRLVWTAGEGIFHIPLQDPTPTAWTIQTYSTASNMVNRDGYKPCWIDEVPHGAGAVPVIYAVSSSFGFRSTTTLRCHKLDANTNTITSPFTADLNLNDAAIVNAAEWAKWHTTASDVLLFQYNPVKKRIYVITSETGLIHIFTVNNASFSGWWDTTGGRSVAIRAGELTYNKALAMAGGAGRWGSPGYVKEHYTVEFDLATGAEKSITTTRVIDGQVTGVVTRSPWTE